MGNLFLTTSQAKAALAKIEPDQLAVLEEDMRCKLGRALANAEMQYR